MVGSAPLSAFVPTTDPDRARAFYADVLGLRPLSQTDFACEFEGAGTLLRVTRVDQVAAAPYTVLGWRVPDIGTALDGLAARGVGPVRYDALDQDERGVWRAPGGARVAWFRDPDGITLSLTEIGVE